MTKRGLYLFVLTVFAVLSLTYALFAPVWFISWELWGPSASCSRPSANPQNWMYGKDYGRDER